MPIWTKLFDPSATVWELSQRAIHFEITTQTTVAADLVGINILSVNNVNQSIIVKINLGDAQIDSEL